MGSESGQSAIWGGATLGLIVGAIVGLVISEIVTGLVAGVVIGGAVGGVITVAANFVDRMAEKSRRR